MVCGAPGCRWHLRFQQRFLRCIQSYRLCGVQGDFQTPKTHVLSGDAAIAFGCNAKARPHLAPDRLPFMLVRRPLPNRSRAALSPFNEHRCACVSIYKEIPCRTLDLVYQKGWQRPFLTLHCNNATSLLQGVSDRQCRSGCSILVPPSPVGDMRSFVRSGPTWFLGISLAVSTVVQLALSSLRMLA